MFLGEAPGRSEDGIGKPFIGPAGDRFDDIVADVQNRIGKFTWIVTNTVACAPYDENNDIGTPKAPHLKACMPRVLELMKLFEPKVLVQLGKVAETAWNMTKVVNFKRKYGEYNLPVIRVAHPSWIEHYCAEPDLEHKRAVLTISEVLQRELPPESLSHAE